MQRNPSPWIGVPILHLSSRTTMLCFRESRPASYYAPRSNRIIWPATTAMPKKEPLDEAGPHDGALLLQPPNPEAGLACR